jgi:hypothetical protein
MEERISHVAEIWSQSGSESGLWQTCSKVPSMTHALYNFFPLLSTRKMCDLLVQYGKVNEMSLTCLCYIIEDSLLADWKEFLGLAWKKETVCGYVVME